MKSNPPQLVIIGAGPAGLGCAYEIVRNDKSTSITILEKNNVVGGLARTHQYMGHNFDVGPHRFFTKNEEVLSLWKELLGNEFHTVPRLTRILYKNRLFLYPINIKDVLLKLGPAESAQCIASYAKAQLNRSSSAPTTFEEWITDNFGEKLYRTFFKTYTEKVWGIPCDQIGAEWAAQRIKNLNVTEVLKTALRLNKDNHAKSLVSTFYYPRHGAGQMYQRMADLITESDGKVNLNHSVTKIRHHNNKITHVEGIVNGAPYKIAVDQLFSSMPLTHFITALDPAPPIKILTANKKLYYRDHLTVNLVINKNEIFPDNWIYVHSPEVKMARVANYNNFAKPSRRHKKQSAISVEYFVFQRDKLWKMPDDELVKLATDELVQVKLANIEDVIDGFVIRESESYPTYYLGHKPYYDRLKDYVADFTNLQLIGRGGMYKYDNMDHAIYSGMLAARNYLGGERKYNVWDINEDAEYQEEIKSDDKS